MVGVPPDDRVAVPVDVPEGDPDDVRVLTAMVCFHPEAVADAVSRSPVAKVHLYADHVVVVLPAPEHEPVEPPPRGR